MKKHIKFFFSFIWSVQKKKKILSVYYMPSIVLGTRHTEVIKRNKISLERTERKQIS